MELWVQKFKHYQPKQSDYLDNKEGFNDSLNFTRPEWIKSIHKKYISPAPTALKPIPLAATSLN